MPRSNAPHPYGPRWARRRRRYGQADPPGLEPTRARRAGAKAGHPRDRAAESDVRDGPFGAAILHGLGQAGRNGGLARHVYGGTVPAVVVMDRRAANRDARRARRAQRRTR